MDYKASQWQLGGTRLLGSGTGIWRFLSFSWLAAAQVLIQSGCVFDGLTGSKPDLDVIGFSIDGPDTVGINDTLNFTLKDRVGFPSGDNEGPFPVVWSVERRTKAAVTNLGSDTLNEASFVAIGIRDTALVVGV